MEKSTVVGMPTTSDTSPATRSAGRRHNWHLSMAVSVACLFTMTNGGMVGYLSPALPNLNEHRNPFRVSDEQQSWAGALVALGSMVGGLLTGVACDRLGRKVAMMLSSALVVVGYTILTAATDYRYLYASMLAVAVFQIINMSAATVYVAEVTPREIRGTCMSLTTLAYSIGIVVCYVVGMPLAWNWLAIFLAATVAAPNLVLAFLPESPRWFLLKGNRKAAVHAVEWFQGACEMKEIAAIEQSIDVSTNGGGGNERSPWKDLLIDDRNRKSLLVVAILFILQGFSGNIVLQMFTVSIFENVSGGSRFDPNVQTIVVGISMVVGSVICPLLVDRVGRKRLIIVSAIIVALSMAAAGTFFRLLDTEPEYARRNLSWLPLVALSASNFGFMVGMFPVAYILSCEMLPTHVRASAQTVFMVVQGLAFFGCVKTFIYVERCVTTSGAFFAYAGVSTATTVFVAFCVKEPKTLSIM